MTGRVEGPAKQELLYVADPMCSWCFAFAPILQALRLELVEGLSVRYVLGGLAKDDDQPMSDETSEYIRGAWRSIEARTDARFNWDYWERCTPRRSTWPACRAVLAAGERGQQIFEAIQRAYYREARDPSDPRVLVEVAGELGFEREEFAECMQSEATRTDLSAEFELRDQLGARAFPSIGVRRGDSLRLLTSGWVDEEKLRSVLMREGLIRRR